jgi:hypothetical protein
MIFVKLRQIARGDERRCISLPDETGWIGDAACATKELHAYGTERVSLVRLAPGARFDLASASGVEMLVVEGSARAAGAAALCWTWARRQDAIAIEATTRSLLWVKRGHLPAT